MLPFDELMTCGEIGATAEVLKQLHYSPVLNAKSRSGHISLFTPQSRLVCSEAVL